ncbi:TlpA family protein disulfide reductase [Planctellipticum variicoloris]|uniref:TlpA family protein disulfide reductase n=1 Tax=Planctellipticum variicoloris TaxID=3064265 RepID=UPI0030135B83|nr:hypothetical protein SH412_002112 [Planctomycetaceae bacterium SH412]
MNFKRWMAFSLILGLSAQNLHAQKMQEREEEFLKTRPLVGDPLPDVTVHSPDGRPFETAGLRSHYTVLTFGCLTCPPSMWNIAGLEAVHQDYGPKGVKFYFIYKSLAHPELAGDYVQPFTLDERLAHARQAEKQLGTRIPWIVDAMDNRLKRALGDRPNSQFLVNPEGIVVRKRAWSHPGQVRKDLEELVGPVEHVTTVEELRLERGLPLKAPAARGVVPRLARPQMMPVAMEPKIESDGMPFFAKLRAEADADLLKSGRGQLYLGFHLDPFQKAKWNNLTKPLSFKIEAADGLKLDPAAATAAEVAATSDCDPREFLLNVAAWPKGQPLRLSVTYFACVGEESCHAVRQEYVLHRERDIDGGGARGEGAGYWDAEEFTARMLAGDRNKDGKLAKNETVGILLPHFEKLDVNDNGFLEAEELDVVADWLNHHHQPGTPTADAAKSTGR